VDSPDLKPLTVYFCAEGLNGRSLNFEYDLDARRAESSDKSQEFTPNTALLESKYLPHIVR
jgi:hypothetical protein